MTTLSNTINIKTKGDVDLVDISGEIQKIVQNSPVNNGIINIFCSGATGAITTIEYEPGLIKDFPAMLDRIAPRSIPYEHHKTWNDNNGHSHCRASLLGPSLTIPFRDKKLILGTWQQVIFVELDTRPRNRSLLCTIIGD
ncbi:MAG: secondary thiamine-phosphate synthase enzyme YjbQ [Candidatus Hermodarchaeota archaeon]